MNDENKAPSNDPEKSGKETDSSGDLTSDKNPEAGSSDESAMKPHSQAEPVIDLSEKVTQCKIDGVDQSAAEAEKKRKSGDGSGKTKSGPEPIVISIVLKMAEFDHKVNHFFVAFWLI